MTDPSQTSPVVAATESATRADWSGAWVADRLGVSLRTTDAPIGVDLVDLVGLAVRRNPRRAHLLVSSVLGKHVPTDPCLVYGAGLLLGRLVAEASANPATAAHPRDPAGGELLRKALGGDPDSSSKLVCYGQPEGAARTTPPPGTVVLGYAETATALGHAVADALDVPYLHSTRRPVQQVSAVGGFEEEHSHATSHLLLPDDPGLLSGSGPLVLVDDELSTGNTALNTVKALHAVHPRTRYLIATLVDLRSRVDRGSLASVAEDIGTTIDVVALTAGEVVLPDDVVGVAQSLIRDTECATPDTPGSARGSFRRVDVAWPHSLREGGRHGFTPQDRRRLNAALPDISAPLAETLADDRRIHVLGFEELMYAPLRIAGQLAEILTEAQVSISATTRSPVLAVDEPGYAIRTRLVFAAHDNPADGPGERYAYNLMATLEGRADAIVLVIDDAADTPELLASDGLVTRLREVAAKVLLVVIPDYRPTVPVTSGETL